MTSTETERQGPSRLAEEAPPKVLPGHGTPSGDALRSAHDAFERGDFHAVRTLTRPLLEDPNREVADAARALLGRVTVDLVQVAVVVACFALLVLITYIYVF